MEKSIKQAMSEILEPARLGKSINAHDAGRSLYLAVSPIDQEILGVEGATKRVTDATKKIKAKTHEDMAKATPDMFDGVDGMMNVGDGEMKPTMSLNRHEAEWVIRMRDKQIIDDTRKNRKLRQLYVRALPAWANPDVKWGDCLKAIAANDNVPVKELVAA